MACEVISQLPCCGSYAPQLLTAPRGDGPRADAHDRPSPVHRNSAGEPRPRGPSRCAGQKVMGVAPPLTSHGPGCAAGGPLGRETRVAHAGMGHGGRLARPSAGPQVRVWSRSAASVPSGRPSTAGSRTTAPRPPVQGVLDCLQGRWPLERFEEIGHHPCLERTHVHLRIIAGCHENGREQAALRR
jgi:hypothetical protein